MAKRIVTKIGDIFCVKLDDGRQRFFQYIANDMSNLNSSVIRVFKKIYSSDYILNTEEVINGDIDFYTHTVLKFGIVENMWKKVGKNPNVGDTEHIYFRMYIHDAIDHRERIWEMWQINKRCETIGKLTKQYKEHSDIGLVFSYISTYERIKTGLLPGSMFTPDEY